MTVPAEKSAKVRQELRAFIDDAFLYLRPDLDLSDDDPLLELGVIDSLGFVELVDEVQERYGVEVEDVEITVENFGSITAIARFVCGKAAL
jgi:acyl carrier protein